MYVGAVDDGIKAFSVVNGRLSSTAVSRTAHAFGYPGAAPAISANGTANAILWAVENTNPAILHALDARDLSHELYASSQAPAGRDTVGPGNKFITPTIANGHVYVGTTNGVAMFGVVRVPSAPTGVHIAL